jgi:hypothetical protein
MHAGCSEHHLYNVFTNARNDVEFWRGEQSWRSFANLVLFSIGGRYDYAILSILIVLASYSCSSGGLVATTPPPTFTVFAPTATAPAPIITMSLDQSRIALGQFAKLTWSAMGATACTAYGA